MSQAVIEANGVATDVRMDVFEAIRSRRSVGKVLPERPPREAVEQILEAATWAPNHRLTEPWRFFVLAGDARVALGDVMGQARISRLHGSPDELQGEFDRAKAKPLRAPVVIAVAVEPRTEPNVVEIEEVAAGAAAVQNMLLAAHGLGLGAMWRTGDPCYDAAVKAFFGLSPNAHLLGFVYLGYPAMNSSRSRHTPAAELTRWIGWDEEPPVR